MTTGKSKYSLHSGSSYWFEPWPCKEQDESPTAAGNCHARLDMFSFQELKIFRDPQLLLFRAVTLRHVTKMFDVCLVKYRSS